MDTNCINILMIIARMGAGGAEKVVAWLSDCLCKDGYCVTVYSLQNVECAFELNDRVVYKHGKKTIRNSNHTLRFIERLCAFPSAFHEIKKETKKNNYSLIISFTTSADIITGLVSRFGKKIRYICSERNDPNRINMIMRALLLCVYRKSSFFVCQSEIVQKYYNAYMDNTVTIPNAINLKEIPPVKKENKKRIVSVGRLDPQKNYKLLINAFSALLNYDESYHLDIYGDGTQREELKRLIQNKQVGKNITLKGVYHNILEEINGSHIFVMTSDYEGFPNALMEAMALGIPIITTNFSPGTAEELIDGTNGIIIPCGDCNALICAMRTISSDDMLREKMRKASLEKIKEYDIASVYPRWKRIIESILWINKTQ